MLTVAAAVQIGTLAIEGVQEARDLWPSITEIAAGRDPTTAEWTQIETLLAADHAALQAARDPSST